MGAKSDVSFYSPADPQYNFLCSVVQESSPAIMEKLDLIGEPVPLLWTADFIPKDAEDGTLRKTEYVVGDCGDVQALADVPDEDYAEASSNTDLIGSRALEMLEARSGLHV